MKKISLIVLVLVLFSFAFTQEKNADIIVLLDNSGTMLPYFSEINEKVLQGICENFLRLDDSFHLLSFTENTVLEISQKIKTQNDIERVVARFSLLYPLGQYSNFIEGLSYSRQFINSLDAYTQKVLVIVSDGIFNPPASSQFYTDDPKSLENAIQTNLNNLQSQGVLVYFIKAPFPEGMAVKDFTGQLQTAHVRENADGLVLTGKSDEFLEDSYYEYASNLQKTNGVVSSELGFDSKDGFIATAFQLPKIATKENLGKKNFQFNFPLIVENTSDSIINLQLDKVMIDGRNVLKNTTFISVKGQKKKSILLKIELPESYKEGEQILHASFEFADKVRTNPQSLVFSLNLVKQSAFVSALGKTGAALLIIGLIIIVLIIILILILKLSRNFGFRSKDEEENEESTRMQRESVMGSIDASKVSSGKMSLTEIANHVADIQKRNADNLASMQDKKAEESVQNKFKNTNKMAVPSFGGNENTLALPSISSIRPYSKLKAASSKDKIPTKKEGNLILELYVEGQTRSIGSRNIHVLSAGSRKSIGGGLSVFSIFFVKLPANIAEIRYDGQSLSLALLKPKYFPEAESNIIEDCLNKPITVISEHGYITRIMFTEYESQTEKLNELLLSVIPEEDKDKYRKMY